MEIKNDAVIFGILILILAVIFRTSSSSNANLKKFYTFVPPLLLCYFIPGFLNWPLGLVSPEESQLYFVASRYLLPASLVLFCLSIDLKGIFNLGPKALIMFITATLGIIIGGPVALWISGSIFPEIKEAVPGEEIWRGLSTIAGSWIGGGANQTAMKEIYQTSDALFSSMIIIDVVVANIWMGFLLYGAGRYHHFDKKLKADNSSIEDLKTRVENYRASIAKIPTSTDLFVILAIGFGATAIAHLGADFISPFMIKREAFLSQYNLNSLTSEFFWLIVIATTIGLTLSFTKLKRYEGAGASRLGSVFIYILVATIGMKMNLLEAFNNLHFFIIGAIWMIIHITLLLIVAKLIKAPLFFVAVGSQANVGGAASAPIVASAFSTALAPVGVLLAVLGYALGTYGAIVSTQLMQWVYNLL
ncbi:MAG TPA: DUF819 family protein [Prolixibacteraceae bacterium]|nr:DUF819 family protein [Prolixibacteraceae bacterium]